MKKNMNKVLRVLTYVIIYSALFIVSMLMTMTILIKGDEISTPDFTGKSIQDARQSALLKSIILKETTGDYGAAYPPQTVVNQYPTAGTSIKENSVVKVFFTSAVNQVVVPDLNGLTLRAAEKLLRENGIKRGRLSYITMNDVPFDYIVSQSVTPGSRISENGEVGLLVSRGRESLSFIMPDLIGQEAAQVLQFFEQCGLTITNIEMKSYYGLRPGIVLKQSPPPGHEISLRNRIGIEVSQ